MVWFQIITVSIASGIWLYYIERENEPRKRRLKYGLFFTVYAAPRFYFNNYPAVIGHLEKFKVSLQNKEAPLCPCA